MKKSFQQLRIDAEGGSVLLEYAIATLVIMLIWYSIDGAGTWTNSLYMLPTVQKDSTNWFFYDTDLYGSVPVGYTAVAGPGTDTFLVLEDGVVPEPRLPTGPPAGTAQTAGIGVRTADTVDYKTYGLLGDNLRARVNRTIQGIASPVP